MCNPRFPCHPPRLELITNLQEGEDEERLQELEDTEAEGRINLRTFWKDSYWTPTIKPMLCLRNAILVGDFYHFKAIIENLGQPFVDSVSSISLKYWYWRSMMDDDDARTCYEPCLMAFTGLKEIIFNLETEHILPPWKTLEDIIAEDMKAIKERYPSWQIPQFRVVRKEKPRQLLRDVTMGQHENTRAFWADLSIN